MLLLCQWALHADLRESHDRSITAIQDAIGRGDLEHAENLLVPALTAHPEDADLINLLGVVHARRGEFKAAREDFARAVVASPYLAPAWQNLARACQAESDSDPEIIACSRKAWQKVLHWRPRDAEAIRGMAVASERQGQFADSLRWMDKVAPDKQALTTDLMIRCLDFAGLARIQDAKQTAALLGSQPDFSGADLQAMNAAGAPVVIILGEALDSRHALATDEMKSLALAYEKTNRLAEARKILERLAEDDPNNLQHLLELAHVAEMQADHEGALGYLGHARQLAPDNGRVHYLFGMVAAKMELPMEARRSFDQALELSPGNADYNFAMGSVILTTRDAASAAAYFEKYIAARPAEARGHYALGVAEFTSGDYEKAKAELRRVQNDAGAGGGAAFFLGRIARLEGDLAASKQYLEKAIQLMPEFSESYTEMARVLMRENRLPAAEAELGRALKLDANSFQAHAQLVALYKRLHDPRAAVEAETLKKLDEKRTARAELMLRGVEIRPQ